MSEPEHLCRTCAHSRTKDGALYMDEDMAHCGRGLPEGEKAPVCPGLRLVPSSSEAGVCGYEGIFWEARA